MRFRSDALPLHSFEVKKENNKTGTSSPDIKSENLLTEVWCDLMSNTQLVNHELNPIPEFSALNYCSFIAAIPHVMVRPFLAATLQVWTKTLGQWKVQSLLDHYCI